jgi:SSS family solute:Na+ symporter
MVFDVSEGAAYAVLYCVLCFFTLLGLGAAGYLNKLPSVLTSCCMLNQNESVGETDYFLSARNSAGTSAIALSFFASGMGAWILYGTTEMGATPQLSWLGVMGYSTASSFPAVVICWLGPMVRARSTEAFSTTDFGLQRYGRVMQISIAAISVFYMFIFIVAELTAISNIFALLTGNNSKIYGIGITIAIGVFTIIYTTLAGLPASIVTDRFQGGIVALLIIMLTLAVTISEENRITRDEFALASNFTTQGLKAAVTLVIAILCAELFNQGTWQRVWAAESIPVMRRGFAIGSAMVFLIMMFFGVMGMIAYAKDPESYDNFEKFAFLAFFDLLLPLGNGWHVLVLILVTALAASSIDSLQNGLTSVFAHDLLKVGWNPIWAARALMVAVNVPAIWLASRKWDVIALFLVADLVCATSVFPVFLGLQTKDFGMFKAPTELGAFMGCVSGIVTVLVNGVVNDAEGGIFKYFWLRNNAICALCGSATMISFIITPAVSFVMTYVFTYADLLVRGERARQPLIALAFDKDNETAEKFEEESVGMEYNEEKSTSGQAVEEESTHHNEVEGSPFDTKHRSDEDIA